MSRLNDTNIKIALEIISHYPRPKSALIPLLHLAQEQDGYITREAMVHLGELVGVTSAEVYGTASFYEMFRFEPVGKYLVNICGTMSCALMGAGDLMHHAEHKLGVKAGGTTTDGMFTLAHAECQAACTEAPTLQVNYRFRYKVTNGDFDTLIDDLKSGKLADEIPSHGVVARIRQRIPADRGVGAIDPELVTENPVWMDGKAAL
jgi:NADH-quinone oxidoreductase subunit E